AYVATLPEWGGCHTHGSTYEEAARHAQEVLESLVEEESLNGRHMPPAHEFIYPGPTGFSYEFSRPAPAKLKKLTRKTMASGTRT
ncbi:MAG TPA: type II toxin-antitoxin system HicB family antitoxin, partial [Tepidisphaeraceae bacterium]